MMIDRQNAPRFFILVFFAAALVLASQAMTSQTMAEGSVTYAEDQIITASVIKALKSDTTLNAKEIIVETDAGVVVLSGSVENQPQENLAVKIATGVKDVKFVKDKLAVLGNETPRED